ncbi:hypothetical protein F5884DRAFT_506943 [Xylogone sp. PMI_703]|nr:hypothetical protein F5884DRAFT_506943 [Xylogone sp. PMI_703]
MDKVVSKYYIAIATAFIRPVKPAPDALGDSLEVSLAADSLRISSQPNLRSMEFDYSSGYSRLACKRCKQLKRKCDKSVPKCHSCAKSRFKCRYDDSQASCPKDDATSSSTSLSALPQTALRSPRLGRDGMSSDFPPSYFLDFELHQRTITGIPRTSNVILPDIQLLTADIREQAKIYFRTIHPWMPFLSQKYFNERLLSPLSTPGTDINLLFACVKLICTHPGDQSDRRYLMVKSALLQAEIAGIFTFRVLQAWILICLYEIGHAIYPSAYLSIGTCARYAAALEVNRNDTDSPSRAFDWIESEERIRAWWAVVILDRFSNLSCPRPSLSTEDPKNDAQLPIDDASWSQGIPKRGCVSTLSTPPTTLMGRYGLTAQAASLLGRTLRHVNESKDATPFYIEEAIILDRAISALTVVANEEGSSRGIGVCTATVLCHSARIVLAICREKQDKDLKNPHCCHEKFILQSGIANDIIKLSQWITSGAGPTLDDEMSLFPLETAYRTAVAYLEMYNKDQNHGYLEGVYKIKAFLTTYNQRWKLAGVYIELIEAREAIWMSNLS